jgi:hypothetical protein
MREHLETMRLRLQIRAGSGANSSKFVQTLHWRSKKQNRKRKKKPFPVEAREGMRRATHTGGLEATAAAKGVQESWRPVFAIALCNSSSSSLASSQAS